MKKNTIAWQRHPLMVLLSCLLLFAGCSPDSAGDLGPKPTNVSFTMTAIPNQVNTYLLQASADHAFAWQWDKGDGAGFKNGKQIDTAYFALKGDYTVTLRAFGRGGYETASQQVSITVDDIINNPIFQLLTAHGWKLDPADGANAIIVGTDGNPSEYFPGGALDNCQKDDVYHFSTNLKLTYNANGATFNGGNLAPNFTCGADRSYADVPFTFTIGGASGAVATITLPGTVPNQFIGVTDVSSNNYRIMSISANEMVLRSGTPSETVHQFKFVAE